ncbi:MAG: hypothetical protein PF508_00380 [Spirochaeta sp.]|jgi:hypothetical protein|nr:hypothetical protein [Spirochaeta sp.]
MNTPKTTPTPTRQSDIRRILGGCDMQFSSDNGWDLLVQHVERHREIINTTHRISAQWHEAVFSWYEEVFSPLYQVISPWGYRHAFGDHRFGDLYLAVSDHWGYLKEYDPDISSVAAARSFLAHYGGGIARHFSRFFV